MHRAALSIDLPSESLPRDSRGLAILKWIFTTGEPAKDRERLVEAGLIWCQRVAAAAAEAGFTDAVALIADEGEVYVDDKEQRGDVSQLIEAIAERGDLEGGFERLELVLSREHAGWHALIAVVVETQVDAGQPEVKVTWSARNVDQRIHGEETPAAYRDRVVAWANSGEACGASFEAANDMLDELVGALSREVAPVEVERWATVVAPGLAQVGRFRSLGFGKGVRGRTHRPRAKERRTGAYDEPHVYYYFDPYHDLLSLLVLREVVEGRWQGPTIRVQHRTGHYVEPPFAGAQWEVPLDAVQLGESVVAVDDRVPTAGGLDRAEAGHPATPGFAGADFANEDG